METKNIMAFTTVSGLALLTTASAIAAAVIASTVATVAYSILGVTLAALSIASVTAWIDPSSTDTSNYFRNIPRHAGYAIAAVYQFVAQIIIQSVIQGIAKGIENAISRKIGGPDRVVQVISS